MPWYESQKWGTYSPYAPGTRAVGSGGAQNTVMNVGPLNAGGGYGAYKNKLYSSITSQVAADLGRRGVASSSAYLQSAVRASAEAELAAWQMRQGDRQYNLQVQSLQNQRFQQQQAFNEMRMRLDQYDDWSLISAGMGAQSVGPPRSSYQMPANESTQAGAGTYPYGTGQSALGAPTSPTGAGQFIPYDEQEWRRSGGYSAGLIIGG